MSQRLEKEIGIFENESHRYIWSWAYDISEVDWLAKQRGHRPLQARVTNQQVRDYLGGHGDFVENVVDGWVKAGIHKEVLSQKQNKSPRDKAYIELYNCAESKLLKGNVKNLVEDQYNFNLEEKELERWRKHLEPETGPEPAYCFLDEVKDYLSFF